ncbi:MAG: FAD-dependent monooxygenase [Rhodobacteraceae bacterium]|nr:FAD-dependent monooxygenase [Paracoccaceae bacterium]
MSKDPIIIAGAGIGGLSAAACLLRAGQEVVVLEQAPVLGEVGAGIQISANAARVYDHLGLLADIEDRGAVPESYRFRMFDDGEVLQSIPLGEGYRARHGVPYVTIHRADLHAALVQAVRALDRDAVRLGVTVTGFEQDNSGVTIHLEGGETLRGAALIGADGIRSAVRRQILGDTPAEYTGDTAWRVIVPAEALPEEYRTRDVDIWVGPRRHAVTYPLRGGNLVNFVGCVEHEGLEDESWTTPRPWQEMHDDFQGWHPMIAALIDRADKGACYRWALRLRPPVSRWTEGRGTLMGDAAHPTLPYMAQGAAMAVEDAAVLARALEAEGGDIAPALALFEQARLPRTTRIVTESSANRHLFHEPDRDRLRASFAARDMNAERSAWLFSYDPLSAPLDSVA